MANISLMPWFAASIYVAVIIVLPKTDGFFVSRTNFMTPKFEHESSSPATEGLRMSGLEPSVMSLLDGEQEKATARRAYDEEEILTKSPSMRNELLMPTEEERNEAKKWIKKCLKTEKLKSGGKSGFGFEKSTKKGKGKNSDRAEKKSDIKQYGYSYEQDTHGFGAILQRDGVVRIDNVITVKTASDLLKYVDDQKITSEKEVANGHAPELSRFSRVLLKTNRCDVLLPYDVEDDVLMQGLYELLIGDGKRKKSQLTGNIGSVIESALGNDAELYELACLISDPGSDRQVIHPDIAHQGAKQLRTGPLITCFVALQDIDQEMGPTEFLPGTNTAKYHDLLNDKNTRDGMLAEVSTKLSLLKAGGCSTFDATTLHAGTANRSDKRRRLFYFTFKSMAMEDPRTWNNPGSIRPEVKEKKLSLKHICEDLVAWKDRQNNK